VAIAADLKVHPTAVAKWRKRFAADRLDELVDAPRPGAVRTIGDDVIEAVVVDLARPGSVTRRRVCGSPGPGQYTPAPVTDPLRRRSGWHLR